MIFVRSALREFASGGTVVFIVLLTITFTTQLIRFLGWAAGGKVPADAVLTLLGFSAIGYLPLLLSITMYLSILLAMSRNYRDSEMVVWFSSGAGLPAWFKPVLLYALPVCVIVGVLSLSLTPWALRKSEEFRHQIEARDDVAAIAPGIFRESKQGDKLYFVEKLTSNLSQVSNVFMYSVQNQQQGVTVAQLGYVETKEDGDRYLVMLNGRRYEGVPGQADYRVIHFTRYAFRLEQSQAKEFFPSQKSTATFTLMQSETGRDKAELVWRFGLPLSTLVLAFFAIPLSAVNPRTGRSFNLILAALLYFVYNNLINVAQSWVGQGRIGVVTALVGLNLCMAGICAFWISRRLTLRRLTRWTA